MLKASSPQANMAWLVIERLCSIALTLFVTVALAQHLMPESFGRFNYLLALVSLVAPLMAMGLNSIISREVINRPKDSGLILGTALGLRCAVSSVVVPLFIGIAYIYLDYADWLLFSVLMLSSIFDAALIFDFWLQAHGANRHASLLRFASLAFFSVVRIAAIKLGAGLPVFVYLAGLELITIGLLYLLVYSRLLRGKPNLRATWQESKILLMDSRWLMLSGVAAMIYLKVDQVMLGVMINDRAVGIYAAAARISEVWYFFPAAIVTAFFPQLIKKRLQDPDSYQLDLQKINDGLFLSALSVALLVTLMAGWALPVIFGPAYADAAPVLVVHVWVGVFVFMRALLSKWFIVENFLKLSMLSQVLGAVVNIILNIYLISLYGPVGAAYATVISFGVSGYIVLFLHRDLWPMARVVTKSILLPYRMLKDGRNLYKV
jgi:PST family polysaccharide transporter